MRSAPASVMGNGYVEGSDTRKIQKINSFFYETSMCQYLPTGKYIEIGTTERNKDLSVKSNLYTKDDH